VGQKFNAKELYDRVKRGSLFFRNSGGGVTLSGGEPLLRTDFVKEFLGECGRIGLSVGVETCGMFDWEEVVPFVSQFDFLYYDIKCMDPILHKKIIGADNDKILANLRKVVETNTKNILITVPVIPGFNDSNENIRATAQLCRQLHIEKITLLAYHSMGAGKYEELGRKYPMGDKAAPPSSLLERLKVIVAKEGITCVSE
jgi:pyruvate formate lyase activating enzyme